MLSGSAPRTSPPTVRPMKLLSYLVLVIAGLVPVAARSQDACPVVANGPDPVMNATVIPGRLTVPVFFHVITGGGQGFVSRQQAASQVAVLNNTYRNTNVRFVLEGMDYVDNN